MENAADALASLAKLGINLLSAGSFLTDGGASMGVLPRKLWEKDFPADELNRIRLSLRVLLVRSEGRTILVDTGLGNRIDEKTRAFNAPEPWCLVESLAAVGLERRDIDTVVLTHLHSDHVGGLVSDFGKGDELTFPNAEHVIQSREWQAAREPDDLNRAAYKFDHYMRLLEQRGNVRLLRGDADLTDEVRLVQLKGHTEGFQAVRIRKSGHLVWYPADLLATRAHMNPAITTAYDICRRETVQAKLSILGELQQKGGRLIFNHDPQENVIRFA